MPTPACEDSSGGLGGRDQQKDPTARKAVLQRNVESLGHDKAHKASWPSTAAKEASSRDASPSHWTLASEAVRVGLSLCNGSATINTFPHRFLCNLSVSLSSLVLMHFRVYVYRNYIMTILYFIIKHAYYIKIWPMSP